MVNSCPQCRSGRIRSCEEVDRTPTTTEHRLECDSCHCVFDVTVKIINTGKPARVESGCGHTFLRTNCPNCDGF